MSKILLVEDDRIHREMMSRYLMLEGHHVLTASDGRQAIALAQDEIPDIILMDMALPVLDGWQATERIKALPQTCAIPIIALTAYAMNEDQEKCWAAGCDEYESKPVDFTRLQLKIQTLLGRERYR